MQVSQARREESLFLRSRVPLQESPLDLFGLPHRVGGERFWCDRLGLCE